MRKVVVIVMAFIAVSCASESRFRNADLLFVVSGDGVCAADSMDGAIALSTGGNGLTAVHVGILELCGDSLWVIDAAPKHGVSRRSLGAFEREYSDSRIVVMRMKGVDSPAKVIERASSCIGRGYDFKYSPCNEELYCSELVQVCYLDCNGEQLFKCAPMNFKSHDGSYPEFWVRLFEQMGECIPQGEPGTNPNDMLRTDGLEYICTLH